ncbi:MAG: sterol desaturase family protein, partial [Litoreibacter sp.]|nr:sterol desaturase family protein [Litoreibacter sp.]
MENETLIRLSIFIGLFAILATIEVFAPRRVLSQNKAKRWM